jgi:hypothetical protein
MYTAFVLYGYFITLIVTSVFSVFPLSGQINCLPYEPGSSVGIATGYGLDGPGIEYRWGRDFPHLSRPALGPTQRPLQLVPGSFPGVESGRGLTLTPHPLLVPRSRKRVKLYL